LATKNTKGGIPPPLFNETILLSIMKNLQVKRKYKQPLPRLPSKKEKKKKKRMRGKKTKKISHSKTKEQDKKKGLLTFKSSPSLYQKKTPLQ
jgi:hypothetical protein